jgi:uncharacterized protein YcnI
MKRMFGRIAIGSAAVALVVAASATSASAHVGIDTLGDVEQGSFATIGFTVPNERDDDGTVQVQVQMPQDHPITFVSVQPVPGWTITTTTHTLAEPIVLDDGDSITEAVDTITWKADGDTQIGAGQFQSFWVSAGPMPTDVDSLAFPTLQTYASGEEVAWIEAPNADGSEPEHPAPILGLTAPGGDAAVPTPDAPASVTSDDSDDADDSDALAITALVVGGCGLVAGIAGIVLARRSRSTPRPA